MSLTGVWASPTVLLSLVSHLELFSQMRIRKTDPKPQNKNEGRVAHGQCTCFLTQVPSSMAVLTPYRNMEGSWQDGLWPAQEGRLSKSHLSKNNRLGSSPHFHLGRTWGLGRGWEATSLTPRISLVKETEAVLEGWTVSLGKSVWSPNSFAGQSTLSAI